MRARNALRRRFGRDPLPEKPPDLAQPPKPGGRADHDPSVLTCVLSGLICGLLWFVFCCVFSTMIFGQNDALVAAVPLGIAVRTHQPARARAPSARAIGACGHAREVSRARRRHRCTRSRC